MSIRTITSSACLAIVAVSVLGSSCQRLPRNPSGLFRNGADEIDFQSGGIGRCTLFGKSGPITWWTNYGQEIVFSAKEVIENKNPVLKWEGADLILLGPNLRFSRK